MLRLLSRLWTDQDGLVTVEYALLLFGFCQLNDPEQEELVQDTENVKRSNRGYGKSQG